MTCFPIDRCGKVHDFFRYQTRASMAMDTLRGFGL